LKKVTVLLVMLATVTPLAMAANGPSLDRGKELFNSPQLGTSGKSCASCHPNGKKLDQVAIDDDEQLAQIINQCIKQPLKGTALEPGSNEMKSLVMYIRSLAKPYTK
jgi:cytochrome c553